MGLKAPRGYGWLTNPKKAAYNRIYSRTSRGCLVSLVVIGILWTSIFLAIASAFAGGKTVHVNGYIRKDGTYVHSYNRAAPGTASVHSTAGRSPGMSYVPSTASTSNSSSVVPRVVAPAQSAHGFANQSLQRRCIGESRFAQGEGRGPGGGGHGRGALVRHAPRAEWNPDAGRAAGVFGLPEPHV